MKNQPEKKKVGMIGSNEVVAYGEAMCLVVGRTWLSIGKIKAVLANLEACRKFLLQYDTAPAKPDANAEKEALLARIKELESKAAGIVASSNGHTHRFDPASA